MCFLSKDMHSIVILEQIVYLQTPAFKERVESDITAEKQKRTDLQKRERQLKAQVRKESREREPSNSFSNKKFLFRLTTSLVIRWGCCAVAWENWAFR